MISDAMETRLTRALSLDARRAPRQATAAEWTTPSRRRVRTRRLAVRAALATAVMAAGASAVMVFGGGNHPAYASWRSVPASVSPNVVAAVVHACQQNAGQVTVRDAAGKDVTRHFDNPLVVDVRGHDAYGIALDGDQIVDCMTTVPGESNDGLPKGVDGWVNPTDLRGGSPTTMPTANNPLTLLSVKSPAGNMVDRYNVTWVAGRIAPLVARVAVTTPTGSIVPSISDGVFAAWWPGNDGDQTTVIAYDSDGHVLAVADELTCPSPRMHVGDRTTGGCSS